MFDSFLAVPLHFTVEFLGFLVAGGGGFLLLSRADLVPGEMSNRITAALGFFALAGAQIAHGGAFIEVDGNQYLVSIRALAYALLLIGLVGGLRTIAVSAATPAFQIRDPLLFAPAGVALLLGFAAFSGSFGSGPKPLRRLAAGGLFLSISEVLFAVEPGVRYGSEVASVYSWGAHAAKTVGFLFVASWLWSAVRTSIRTRFVASFSALLVVVVLILASSLTGVLTDRVDQEELARARTQLSGVMTAFEEEDINALKNDIETLSGIDTVVEQVAQNRDLQELAETIDKGDLADLFDLDFVIFTDSDGRILARSGVDQIEAVKISGSPVMSDLEDRTPFSASPVRIGKGAALLAGREITDPLVPSRVAGILLAGRNLADRIIDKNDHLKPAALSLIVGNRVVTSRLPKAVRSELKVPGEIRADLGLLQVGSVRQTLGGEIYYSSFSSLDTASGERVGVVALSTSADTLSGTREALTRVLFLVAMGVGVLALLIAWLSGRRITRPIQLLTSSAGAVREGDLSVQTTVSGEDEVGRLGETFNEMTSSLFRMTNDLREAAREEYQLRARIETIIESMADGLVATDADMNIVAFNREAEVITGIKARRAVGKNVKEVLDARDVQNENVHLPIFDLARGSVDNIYLRRKNGDMVPVAFVSAVLTGEEGEVAGGVGVLRDMSREREIERMKTEFLSNISHELRTPLTPIKGYAEILGRKEIPPEKTKKFASGILESTERLERIVELLVDFSAMEAGRMAPRAKPVDIGALLSSVAEEWSRRTSRHEVVLDVEGSLPKVSADERLIKRTLNEIVDNAVKFSPSGGVVRLVAKGMGATAEERRHGSVAVAISDEGIGIPPEDVPKIFSDFHQLDGSETRSYGGLGLGLAFVARIIEAHGGSIEVDSRVGEGTTMTVRLPAAKRARSEAGQAVEPASVRETQEDAGEDADEADAAEGA